MTAAKQYIFQDDAGDAGFKFKRGSSRYFVIACVIFDDPLDVEFASVGIRMFRRSLGWKDTHEFKFNKNCREDRTAFLKAVQNYNFKVRAIVIDKTLITDERLRKNGKLFYLTAIRDVLDHFGDRMDDAKVILDGEDVKGQTQKVRAFLRHALNTDKKRMRDFKPADSVKEVLVQLADMVAGSIYRSLQPDKTDFNDYLPLIESKIEDIWNCPG
ncbi:MAG: DUF3800 domain-containing protein [Coriobacteriales bacterium]|nr:DUF3800 domain-containing protein [Coriobacteriales bacterium]